MQSTDETKKFPLSTLIMGMAAAGAIAFAAARTGGVSGPSEVELLNQLAKSGDTGAQLQLGLAYEEGRYGLKTNPQTGLFWLTAAARHGDAYAADEVAKAYATGYGTQRDPQQALHWWAIAAEGGNADAQTHMGEYLIDTGEKREGVALLRNAADRGDPIAHADLAELYGNSEVRGDDLQRGENPLNALGERMDSAGLKAVFTAWRTLETSSPLMQSADALRSRANAGDPVAEYELAICYRDGAWAVNRDPQQEMTWLKRSAKAGNRIAAQTLAEERHGDSGEPQMSAPPVDSGRT